jgi:OOP family OmpA-OmpF porin
MSTIRSFFARWLAALLIPVPTLLLVLGVHAQFVADYKRTADMFFARQDFYSAALYYEKALAGKPAKESSFLPYAMDKERRPNKSSKMHQYEELVYRLAESYRGYRDYANAERWYEQASQFSPVEYPLARYWYGICLHSDGKFGEALNQFQLFQTAYTAHDEYQASADKEISDCRFAIAQEALTGSPFTVMKLGSGANEGGANYAPVWWTNQLFFTSSRSEAPNPKTEGGKDPFINHLYSFSGSTASRLELPGQVMEQGVSTLSPDGLTMYLTQWALGKDGKKQADLYRSDRRGTSWTEPARISTLDVPGFSTMQPSFGTDGRVLLFASDRPGGSGGFDLWYAPLDSLGNPGTPVNLGPGINTPGDEEAPYYDSGLRVLIFSTNGRVGMGNFDLFQSTGDLSNLSTPVNLGFPINSPKDDMYFTSTHAAGKLFKEAYISSDRASTCCLELFKVTRRGKHIGGKVADCDSGQPLLGATVSLVDTVAQRVLAVDTLTASGTYGFDLDDPGNFKVIAEKDNYFTKSLRVRSEEMEAADTVYNIQLCLKYYPGPGKPIVLQNIFYDYNKASLRPESMTVLDTLVGILDENPTMTIQMGAHTDGIGGVKYNLDLSARRAQSCVDYLISKGIDPARLTSHGFGKCCPIAPETLNGKDNPAGRQTNRRTEFVVLHK